jgi:protein TonB
MADVIARSVDRSGATQESRPRLTVIAGTQAADRPKPVPAPSPRLALVLSRSSDLLGVGASGWAAAVILYAALATAILWVGWKVVPPEAWPENQAAFRVIFEEPPALPQPVAQAEVLPQPLPESAPPPEKATLPEPEPAATIAVEPAHALEAPKPPPVKPRTAAVRSPRTFTAPAAPSAEAPVAAPAAQVAAAPILPPRPITGVAGNQKPDYPSEARRRGIQGRVVLRVEVSAAGTTSGVTVISTSGHQALDKAALTSVQRWRFNPATQGGTPVAGIAEVPIQFRLED